MSCHSCASWTFFHSAVAGVVALDAAAWLTCASTTAGDDSASFDRPRGHQPIYFFHQAYGLFEGDDGLLVVLRALIAHRRRLVSQRSAAKPVLDGQSREPAAQPAAPAQYRASSRRSLLCNAAAMVGPPSVGFSRPEAARPSCLFHHRPSEPPHRGSRAGVGTLERERAVGREGNTFYRYAALYSSSTPPSNP